MFPRTFAIKAKKEELKERAKLLDLFERQFSQDLPGKRPSKFTLFADVDLDLGKVVFYDMSTSEHVIEFSSIFARLPEFSIECSGEAIKMYYFNPDEADARVLAVESKDGGDGPRIIAVKKSAEETAKEAKSLQAVASSTHGFVEIAADLSGIVNCSVVENTDTGEKRAFFAVKVDAKSEANRAILRSTEEMHFAWSDQEASNMIFLCRFRMLPLFALSFPLMGKNIIEAMELYTQSKRAVGVVMFTDDESDSFTIENEKPKFE